MPTNTFKEAIISGIKTGVVCSVLIVLFVYFTGNTFEQRCASMGHDSGSVIWKECVVEKGKG